MTAAGGSLALRQEVVAGSVCLDVTGVTDGCGESCDSSSDTQRVVILCRRQLSSVERKWRVNTETGNCSWWVCVQIKTSELLTDSSEVKGQLPRCVCVCAPEVR